MNVSAGNGGSYRMLKQHNEFFKGLLLASDLCFVSLAWWFAFLTRFYANFFPQTEPFVFNHYVVGWLAILAVWTGVFELCGIYRPRRISTHRHEIAELIKASALALLVFLGIIFLIHEAVLSRMVVVIFWFSSVIFLNLSHIFFREGLRYVRRHGHNLRRVVIVGTSAQAQALLSRFKTYRHLGLNVAGLYLIDSDYGSLFADGVDLLRNPDELFELARSGNVDQVFVALPLAQASKLKEIQAWIGDEPVALYFIPDLGDLATLRGSVEEFDGLQIISLQSSPHNGWNALSKRFVDITIGGVALFVFAPLMAAIAVAIKFSSRGTVLYRQERMGLDGRRFQMLKFRTMVEDAEEISGPVWATDEDPRVTPVGRWLRQSSLDELPQLINVLRGEMSLVGPRPERPPLIDEFRKTIPKYMLRHKVKAGMTGWAQIHGWRGNTSLSTRIEYDLDYIENWSLGRDLQILFWTLLGGFRSRRTSHS
jgi:Undecaprenyl-phosphate glucose phosphotransferase